MLPLSPWIAVLPVPDDHARLRFTVPDDERPAPRASGLGCSVAMMVFWLAAWAGMTAWSWAHVSLGGQYFAWAVGCSVSFPFLVFFFVAMVGHDRDLGRPPPALVLDASGITVEQGEDREQFLWTHIAVVGVLRLRTWLRRDGHRLTEPVLLVRPAAGGVRLKSTRSAMLLSGRLRRLGYVGLCSTGAVGALPADVVAGLKQFAGDRVADTEQDFRRLDPRLGPVKL
jgi:hypothetical protein